MRTERQIIFHEHHFVDFYAAQTKTVQEKIEYVFKIIRNVDNIPKKFLDHMTGSDGIFEIGLKGFFNLGIMFSKGGNEILNSHNFAQTFVVPFYWL